jgi:hypothetical protein
VAGLAAHLFDLKLARLPNREVEDAPKRRGSGLLLEINVEVLENHGFKSFEVSMAARNAVAASKIDLESGALAGSAAC